MLSNYEQLKKLVKTGQLKLDFVFSVPRARSQAFQIALTQAPEIDGQLNLPFCNKDGHFMHYTTSLNDNVRTFEIGCQRILERVNALEANRSGSEKPIRLLVHEHFSNIIGDEISHLLELSENYVILIRHPYKQIFSFLTRTINDKLSIPFNNALSPNDVLKIVKNMENVASSEELNRSLGEVKSNLFNLQILRILGKQAIQKEAFIEDIKAAYEFAVKEVLNEIKITWENFEYNFNILVESQKNKKIHIVIVDSEFFIEHPESVLNSVTNKLSEFSYSANMINRWEKGAGSDFHCCHFTGEVQVTTNAWVGPSRTSGGLTKEHDVNTADLDLDQFPKLLHEILNYAVSIYNNCYQKNNLRELLACTSSDQGVKAAENTKKLKIVISATFTADLLKEPFQALSHLFKKPSEVKFAPYHQVFQQLLDKTSMIANNKDGINILLVRFEDWQREQFNQVESCTIADILLRKAKTHADELIDALMKNCKNNSAPCFLLFCPSRLYLDFDEAVKTHWNALEEEIKQRASFISNCYVLSNHEFQTLYPVSDCYDQISDEYGHIPYTSSFYAALAIYLMRKIDAYFRNPYKVIVLDCDNTLWEGIVGESDCEIKITPPFKQLQQFILKQREMGMLLCLCSKNNEKDVFDILDNHPDMILKKQDFVAFRINWNAKSHNIIEISRELNLDLSSFIVIDDNPVECAEIQNHCSAITVVTLPAVISTIPHFLNHLWIFDHLKSTEEDKKRTLLYKREIERRRFQNAYSDFESFLKNLNLTVDIHNITSDEFERVAQLTQRTNQFNTTTLRLKVSDIQEFCNQSSNQCFTVKVKDRFGDYGLVGVILTERINNCLFVRNLLLSCRVLGRGVEHTLMQYLGQCAEQSACSFIAIDYSKTDKNEPVSVFLNSFQENHTNTDDHSAYINLSSDYAKSIEFKPKTIQMIEEDSAVQPASSSIKKPLNSTIVNYQEITFALSDLEYLLKIMFQSDKHVSLPEDGDIDLSHSIEDQIKAFFCQVLRLKKISIFQNFFHMGGDSLLATQIMSRINKCYGLKLTPKMIFEIPTVLDLASKVAQLLNERDKNNVTFKHSKHIITHRMRFETISRGKTIPLSFSQERLWFLDQYDRSKVGVYNTRIAFSLLGPLDQEALLASIKDIVIRHESLRTTFIPAEHGAEQLIGLEPRIHCKVRDLSRSSANLHENDFTEQQRTVEQISYEEAHEPFNLSQGPLIRGQLLCLASNEYILLLTFHHIICDRWSLGIFCRELSLCYSSRIKNQSPQLPFLQTQYADFAIWQKLWLKGKVLDEQLSYWKKRLENYEILNLPTDKPRPLLQTFVGSHFEFFLPTKLTQALHTLAIKNHATLFTVLLATFNILLSRYSGQTDIIIGTPIANRNHIEVEELIGFFVNTLALRNQIPCQQSFNQFLQEITQKTFDDYQYQDLPFEKLVEALPIKRDLSRNPLFQVMLVLLNMSDQVTLNLPGIKTMKLKQRYDVAKFDLTFTFEETSQGLLGSIEYNTDLFERCSIERMVEHFKTLLFAILSTSDLPISLLPMLTAKEQQQIMVEWNKTESAYSVKTLFGLFEEQVDKTPNDIAVVFEDKHLTYSQLNQSANQVAHLLRDRYQQIHQKPLPPDTLIFLCLERSLEIIVCMLGILKAGAAYVPLDPHHPKERISFMLEDANAPLLVTMSNLSTPLCNYKGQIVYLDQEKNALNKASSQNPYPITNAHHLAYVLYTSGSTGEPKGVMIEQRSVINLIESAKQKLPLSQDEKFLALAPFTFDISGLEVYLPLFNGYQVIIASDSVVRDGFQLQQLILQHSISVIQATPFTWEILLETGWKPHKSIKVLCGGESLPLSLAQKLLDENALIYHFYGPTETTIWSTLSILDISNIQSKTITIGKPLANTQAYILDKNFQPCPVGVSGELFIGGVGVARGYLNRPMLTKERFIEKPSNIIKLETEANGRLYKTGDLARWLSDGNIEVLGRVDFQIKIRGVRIECGEIEHKLARYPGVSQVVVIAHTKGNKQYLIAYYTTKKSIEIETDLLKDFCKESLPGYMMPHFFIPLSSFTLTANGKIDRKSLPLPNLDNMTLNVVQVTPQNALENQLVAIWTKVLGLSLISVDSNFFSLGGNSLLAMKVYNLFPDFLKNSISLIDLFKYPTIRLLAIFINETLLSSSKKIYDSSPVIHTQQRPAQIPLSFGQQRMWFLHQLVEKKPLYNIASALNLKGMLNISNLEKSLQILVERHEILRTIFSEEETGLEQQVKPVSLFKLHQIDLTHLPSIERQEQALIYAETESNYSFNLSSELLFRAKLISISTQEHLLLMTWHHSVVDGWSLEIFYRELSTLYNHFTESKDLPLDPVLLQYADYTLWQRQQLQGEELKRQLTFWRDKLEGVPQFLNLPTDHPRPVYSSFAGSDYSFKLSKIHFEKLKTTQETFHVTLFMLLMAAFQILLYRYSHQKQFIVGTVVAGRQHSSTSDLMGFCANTLALPADCDGGLSFSLFLKQIKEMVLACYEYQELPFEYLLSHLNFERKEYSRSLFQVMLNMQNNQSPKFSPHGVEVEIIKLPKKWAKFDLMLNVRETATGELDLNFEYATDLFEKETIKRMATHYIQLIQRINENPNLSIDQLPLLTPEEEEFLLIHWNKTQSNYPSNHTLSELFEIQVEKTPDAIALIDDKGSLTYKSLNERANELGHYLKQLGVKNETRVGISLERSSEFVVGILAILKAGGAYVPLDPHYPTQRLSYMLNETQADILLTDSKFIHIFSDYEGKRILIDKNWQENLLTNKEKALNNFHSLSTAKSLAYVIYTSGSTGKPKGTLIEHKSVIRLVKNTNYIKILPEDNVAHASNISFDATTFEIWGAILNGATLVIIPQHILIATHQLEKTLEKQQISIMWVTAGLFDQIANESPQAFAHLKYLLVGGDILNPSAIAKVFSHKRKPQALINGYGPTENTTFSTFYLIEKVKPPIAIPIGKPISNSTAYILDAHLKLVPIGVTGELYVGGDGVARGYLNQPELTRERFISDPFSLDPDAKLYRTGDLARLRVDGNIEYLGRIDRQVKLRGFRIELGEIESQIRRKPEVQDVVIVMQGECANKQLMAYLVLKSNSIISQPQEIVNDLTMMLKQQLPSHMLPYAYVFLQKLPLTMNGKIDRVALATTNQKIYSHERKELVLPTTELERDLVLLWSEILQISDVGVEDNFFKLGGHSLLIAKLLSKIRHKYKVELSLATFFECPTIRQFAQTILHAQKKLKLPTPRVNIRSLHLAQIPLSFQQQGLWFLYQLMRDKTTYNITFGFKLKGKIDKNALESAYNTLLRRHEIFRTYFTEIENQPRQIIQENVKCNLHFNDFTLLSPEEQERKCKNINMTEAHLPFNLNEAPLWRSQLTKLSEKDFILILSFHHIIFDGESLRVFLSELSKLYNHYAKNHLLQLDEPPIQYADFAVWQHEYTQNESYQSQLAYWQTKLANLPEKLSLPLDFPRPKVQTWNGRTYHIVIPKDRVNQLKDLSASQNITLFILLLAIVKVLLHRYCNQDDIIVGTPTANRQRLSFESMIGFFANTFVLHTYLGGNPTFIELLNKIRETVLTAYSHQDVSFTEIVKLLKIKPNASWNPLFQVMMVLLDHKEMDLQFADVKSGYFSVDNVQTKFDITFAFIEQVTGELTVEIEYAKDLFHHDTIAQIASHLTTLFQEIILNPDARIDSFALLTKEEINEQILQWNDTTKEYPYQTTLQTLFENQVMINKNAIAIVDDKKHMTYTELNEIVNQLANNLHLLGVGTESLVAICLKRSLEMIIAILAILKAGGAYVPLDPAYPRNRLITILDDTKAPVLITSAELSLQFNSYPIQFFLMDEQAHQMTKMPIENFPSRTTHKNLAYVMYTSGSTGNPKGVMIEQGSLIARLLNLIEIYELTKHDSTLFHSSYSFDASIEEIFLPLLVGGRMVVARQDAHENMEFFLKLIKQQKITCLNFSPALLQFFLENIANYKAIDYAFVRNVSVGGEALNSDVVSQFYRYFSANLFNFYGPTENTVDTTVFKCALNSDTLIPIGKPLANTVAYILDPSLNLLPRGVVGELYVGGIGLARGYLNLPELTKQRFIKNPFVTEDEKAKGSNTYLYKTGDLARYLHNGSIQFCGRVDTQVKLRGYRIELEEIEAVLRQHADISNAVVVLHENEETEKYLVAYLLLKSDKRCTEDVNAIIIDLRQFLINRLPYYMVPETIMSLQAVPLTVNGKLDRRRLPKPFKEANYQYIAPRTIIEQDLAEIWSVFLSVNQSIISVNSHFFVLGGHSLIAARLRSYLHRKYKIKISLQEIFNHPKLEDLAYVVENAKMDKDISEEEIIRNKYDAKLIPASFAQERIWILDKLTKNAAYNVPTLLRLRGKLNILALEYALNVIINRHDILRTVLIEIDNSLCQYVFQKYNFKLNVIRLTELLESEREQAVIAFAKNDAVQRFDLAKGPLLRLTLFNIDEMHFLLNMNMHHSIFDQGSWSIFIYELSELYNANCLKLEPKIENELCVQYGDFARWQRNRLQNDYLTKQLDFWSNQLQNAPELIFLPLDKPRPDIMSYRGDHYIMDLPNTLLEELKRLGARQQATLFMTMLSLFYVFLYRYSGQADIVVGTPVTNRNESTEKLIGFFLNTLAFRCHLPLDLSFEAFLRRVRDNTLEGYQYQDVSFEKVVDYLKIKRDASFTPLFQVMLIVLTHDDTKLSMYDIDVETLKMNHHTAKFDLTLFVREHGNGVLLDFEYATDLFEEGSIRWMAEYFKHLLETLVLYPKKTVRELSSLMPPTHWQVLTYQNKTQFDYPHDKTVQRLFEEQTHKEPHAIAIDYEGYQLTYIELNRRSNQLAHYLQSLGVSAETLVAIVLDRSPEMIIAMLAILKTGGAYVPLDPIYPVDRIKYILNDASVSILITNLSLIHLFSEVNARRVCIDIDLLQYSHENLINDAIKPADLAYVLYTSGSTGHPKGVMVEQRNIVNFLFGIKKLLPLTCDDRMLAMTTIAFDIAGLEIFLPLITGARIVLMPSSASKDGKQLADCIKNNSITVMQATPTMWQILLETKWEGAPDLTLLCGGEALSRDLAERLISKGKKLINLYGPTETTIWSTYSEIQSKNEITMGCPLANTQVYLLDETLQPVPLGAIGEIFIGGEGVARGYYKREELTNERFIANPFVLENQGKSKNTMLYKTGDLARYLSNGKIQYLGRIDQQVKLRGYRIELEEIEILLRKEDTIANAAVVLREDDCNIKHLVAYLVLKQQNLNNEELNGIEKTIHQSLMNQLPNYMLPSRFEFLNELPITPNGKLDRKMIGGNKYKPLMKNKDTINIPSNYNECLLLKIWEKVLGNVHFGTHDNFFELGGDSLLAVRLVNEVNQIFHLSLSVANILKYPTIESFARFLENGSYDGEIQTILPIVKKNKHRNLFLIHAAGGLALPYLSLAKYLINIDLYGINNPRFGRKGKAYKSIEEMASDYIKAIKSVQKKGPYKLGGWSFGGVVALEIAIQLKTQGEKVTELILFDSFYKPDFFESAIVGVDSPEVKNFLSALNISTKAKQAKDVQFEFQNSYQLLANYKATLYQGHAILLKAAMTKSDEDRGQIVVNPNNGWENILTDLVTYSVNCDHDKLFVSSEVSKITLILNEIFKGNSMSNENNKLHNEKMLFNSPLKQSKETQSLNESLQITVIEETIKEQLFKTVNGANHETSQRTERHTLTQHASAESPSSHTHYLFHQNRGKNKQSLTNEIDSIVLQLTQWLSLIECEESEYKNQRNFYGTEPYLIHYEEGDCLFASIAAFVPNETAMSLRERGTQHIEQDEQLKGSIITLINSETPETLRTKKGDQVIKTFQQYIFLMQTEETWGTAIEIIALARSLQRPVAILTPRNQYDYIVEEDGYQENEPIFLNYVGEIHYAPLSVPADKDAKTILQTIREAIAIRNNEQQEERQPLMSSS